MQRLYFVVFILLCGVYSVGSKEMNTTAKQAYVYDLETDTVMLNKSGETKMYPASMTKMMTVYIVFEALKDGSLSMDDAFLISKKSWRKGGSKMFVNVGDYVTIENLLRGAMIQSGNDASIALAEGMAGTEGNFVKLMNAKAIELGMDNTNFMNCTGWADENHYTTAKDLVVLARDMIERFPEYYKIWKEKSFTYNSIKQRNRNALLFKNIGGDGIKTGHTEISGYGITGTVKKNNRRVIFVLNGMRSKKERAEQSHSVALSALYDYKKIKIFSLGDVLETADVWMGQKTKVSLVTQEDLSLLLSKDETKNIEVSIKYNTPLQAPILQGSIVGSIVVKAGSRQPETYPLYTGESIDNIGFFNRLKRGIRYFLWGRAD